MAHRIISKRLIGIANRRTGRDVLALAGPQWLRRLTSHLILAGTRFAVGTRILAGYVTELGNKYEIICDVDGPASYSNPNANNTVSTTGGQLINASDLGMGGFELVDAQSLSSDILNTFLVWLPNQSSSASNVADASATCRVYWFVQATAAQVANGTSLTGKSVRLQIRAV